MLTGCQILVSDVCAIITIVLVQSVNLSSVGSAALVRLMEGRSVSPPCHITAYENLLSGRSVKFIIRQTVGCKGAIRLELVNPMCPKSLVAVVFPNSVGGFVPTVAAM